MARTTKPKRGRPRRTDSPVAIRINLPGKLRQWLRVQAALEGRDQGDIITDALIAYRMNAKHMRELVAEVLDTTDTPSRRKGGKR